MNQTTAVVDPIQPFNVLLFSMNYKILLLTKLKRIFRNVCRNNDPIHRGTLMLILTKELRRYITTILFQGSNNT